MGLFSSSSKSEALTQDLRKVLSGFAIDVQASGKKSGAVGARDDAVAIGARKLVGDPTVIQDKSLNLTDASKRDRSIRDSFNQRFRLTDRSRTTNQDVSADVIRAAGKSIDTATREAGATSRAALGTAENALAGNVATLKEAFRFAKGSQALSRDALEAVSGAGELVAAEVGGTKKAVNAVMIVALAAVVAPILLRG